jgi:hypothetical protein
MECMEFVKDGLPNGSFEETNRIKVRFSGSAGGQMGGRWHQTCGRIRIFLRN